LGTLLTTAAVLALAGQCQHSFPPEMILAIARNESMVAADQFDPAAVNVNKNGTKDIGLMQINTSNLGWLGLTEAAVMDPCIAIGAAEAVLKQFSAYNSGSGTASPAYAKRAYLRMHGTLPIQSSTTEAPHPDTTPDQSKIFASKARIGRELVINMTKESR
jgi:hypothetical protein